MIDFSNTKIAFENKSDKELKKAAWLFKMMNKSWLVQIGSSLGASALKLGIPFTEKIIKNTIFEQFCGGTSLADSQGTINRLFEHNVRTILDYGAEAKSTFADYENTKKENIAAIKFAAENESVPIISTKISGLTHNSLLEKKQLHLPLTEDEKADYQFLKNRIDEICQVALAHKVGVFFDAEESWIQDTIDELVMEVMQKYNQDYPIVYNTYQLYRHDRLALLKAHHQLAKKRGVLLGAKLVRGAYMEKERERAKQKGYPSPIQKNKEATDQDYNLALRYCVQHYQEIACCNASHNQASNQLLATLIEENNIKREHLHFIFSQLYGMSDHLTFNLAAQGYNASKYLPYGKVKEVIPYLIRRAQENSSVTGDMTRERSYILKEMKRRKI